MVQTLEDLSALDFIEQKFVVANPIYSGEKLVDLELDQVGKSFENREDLMQLRGSRLSNLFPDLVESPWLEQLSECRGTGEFSTTHRRASDEFGNPNVIYELAAKWLGEQIFISVNMLSTSITTASQVVGAAATISGVMRRLPITYLVRKDTDWLRFATSAFIQNFKTSEADTQGLNVFDVLDIGEQDRVKVWLDTDLDDREMPLVVRTNELSKHRWLEIWAESISGEDQQKSADFMIIRDVDPQVRLQHAFKEMANLLESQLDVLSQALNASNDGFAIWSVIPADEDKEGSFRLDFINNAGAAATGKKPHKLIGKEIEEVLGPDQSDSLSKLFAECLTANQPVTQTVEIDSENGWVGAYENRVIPISDNQLVTSFRDVSTEQRERQRLTWLAENDFLTGICNRNSLEEAIRLRAEGDVKSNAFAFVFLDLDNFKTINDTYGHDVGDEVLKEFAHRLTSNVMAGATVARISGDEFGILFPSCMSTDALKDALEKIFDAQRVPYKCGNDEIRIGCSAGGAIVLASEPVTEIMRVADRAMYQSKYSGKGQFRIVELGEAQVS